MNILLLAVYNDDMMKNLEEVGICCIASFLRQHGHQVKLMGVLENRVNYDEIIDFNPAITGLPVYDISKKTVYQAVEQLKRVLPEGAVCVGGTLPTYSGKIMLEECPHIDFAVKGEGEMTFLELVTQLQQGRDFGAIKGLIYRHRKGIRENDSRPIIGDIDSLPMPARDILRDNHLVIAQISTSRGCTARCTFCMSGLFWKKWRGRNPESVVDEIEHIANEFGIKTFNFIDGSFEDPGTNVERIRKIARGIVERDLNISYFVDLRAEFYRKATPELMGLLKNSGLCGVCVGIESANEPDLKLYGKIASLDDNIRFIEMLRRYEINPEPGFINFNPYTTFKGLGRNIDFLEKYRFASNFDYIVNRYKMYSGTPLSLKIKNDSLLKKTEINEYGYRFTDKRIENLYDFIDDYLMEINRDFNSAIHTISYYSVKYLTLLTHLKRQFRLDQAYDGHKIVLDHERSNSEILADVNLKVADWFRKLLSLAETGWNKREAMELTHQGLGRDYIQEVTTTLNKFKNRLYFKLVKVNLGAYIVSLR